jgi:hypothetical protein
VSILNRELLGEPSIRANVDRWVRTDDDGTSSRTRDRSDGRDEDGRDAPTESPPVPDGSGG